MWKVLRVFKQYSNPQQLRIFSTNSNCIHKECNDGECEESECDTFGTLSGSGKQNVQNLVKAAADKYPIKNFNERVKTDSVRCEKQNDYTNRSNLQNLHSFNENKLHSSGRIADIVSHAGKKYLLSKIKTEEKEAEECAKQITRKLEVFDSDGTIVQLDKDKDEFRSESMEQFTPFVFHKKMERLLQEKKFLEAIDVFEKEMPESKVDADTQVFGLTVGIYAKLGYSKKAFEIYNRMKQENIFISKRTITSLFNACALSPWPKEDGLPRAIRLKQELKEKDYEFNNSQYCSMIKAFGRGEDIETAFGIVDEMVHKNMLLNTTNINFLLQACISDKEVGFRHGLLTWKKMRNLHIHPDIYSYNLLLRCIRDCKSGDGNLIDDLLDKTSTTISDSSEKTEDKNTNLNFQAKGGDTNMNKIDHKTVSANVNTSQLPLIDQSKILDGSPLSNKIIGFSSLQTCEDRFALVGGLRTFLKNMHLQGVIPTLNTFGLLMQVIPPNTEDEEKIFKYMDMYKLQPEISTINQLINKRCKRGDYLSAQDALDKLTEFDLIPNVVTFEAMAITCNTHSKIQRLRTEMNDANIRLTHNILSILLKNCVEKSLYVTIFSLLYAAKRVALLPDFSTLKLLEEARNNIRNELLASERLHGKSAVIADDKRKFLLEYKIWLQKTNVHKKNHPWSKYGYEAKPKFIKISDKEFIQ